MHLSAKMATFVDYVLRLEKGWRIVSKTYLRVEDSEAQATLHPDSAIFCAAAHAAQSM
jgi:hypothetical protein